MTARMAIGRGRFALAALCVLAVGWTIVEAAFMKPPHLNSFEAGTLFMLVMLGGGATIGVVHALRSGPARLERRELSEAIELAAVMMVDQYGVVRHWSRGCEALYGWTAEEAIGRQRYDLLRSDVPAEMRDIETVLRDQGRADFELVERHRDGRALIVGNHGKLFDHHDGRFSAVFAVTDTTARRQAEVALRLSEMRLATAVAVQGIFIYEYDVKAERPIWTSRGESFFGLPSREGEPLSSDIVWNWAVTQGEPARALVDRALAAKNGRVHFDFDFHYPDGTPRRAEGWAKLIRNQQGEPIRILGTSLDVTERREQEAALRAGEAEKEAILATVPDAMLVCSDRGVIRSCSATAAALFGHSTSALIGRKLVDFVADEAGRRSVRREFVKTFRRSRDVHAPTPVNIRGIGGEIVPVSFVVGDAVVEGTRMFVIFGRDMRPGIAAEEKFRRLGNELAQISRLGMMGEMAGALAHELSQPLAAIVNFLGAVDLMLDRQGEPEGDPDQLRFAVQSASEQAARAGEIIRRLRAFILRGETDMRAEPLGSLVREAAALTLFNTPSLGMRLTYELENEDRMVLGDRIQIQQVLVNLIRNGADAMTASGSERREMLIASALTDDGMVVIEVQDSGPGIAPEMLEKLFSPFATTKREGLGFGLAISRRIVEAHGGQLSASAAVGGGTIFRFTLPVIKGEGLA